MVALDQNQSTLNSLSKSQQGNEVSYLLGRRKKKLYVNRDENIDSRGNPSREDDELSSNYDNVGREEFLRDVGKIAEELGVEGGELLGRISDLVRSKYRVSLLDVVSAAAHGDIKKKKTFCKIPISGNVTNFDERFVPAYNKIMALKGKVVYQTARGGAARPLFQWVQEELVDTGLMTVEELESLPMWVYQKFDARLAAAFHNAKRR